MSLRHPRRRRIEITDQLIPIGPLLGVLVLAASAGVAVFSVNRAKPSHAKIIKSQHDEIDALRIQIANYAQQSAAHENLITVLHNRIAAQDALISSYDHPAALAPPKQK